MYETTYRIFDLECTVLFSASGENDPCISIEEVEFDKTNLSKEDVESVRLEILDNWGQIRELCGKHYLSGRAYWTDPIASTKI